MRCPRVTEAIQVFAFPDEAIHHERAFEAVNREQWIAMKAVADHRCLRCRWQEPEIRLTLDHIIPVSKGGDSSPSNIQPLCRSCNSSKHTDDTDYCPVEWPWQKLS